MRAKAKIFVSSDDMEGVFGDGKWHLLKAVEKYGSIQKAAESLERGYRKTWGDIKRAEEGLGKHLVSKSRGGNTGGSTTLTEFGLALVEAWDLYRKSIRNCLRNSYSKHLKQLMESE